MSTTRSRLASYAGLGLVVNAALAIVKGVAGVLGNSYALVADAVESSADVLTSLIVWGGLRIAAREPDEEFHYGYGKAEPMAAAVVGVLLAGAAIGIAVEAVREIHTPHDAPARFTLIVLVVVVLVKEVLFRRLLAAGDAWSSTALAADAWHHRSDAITSLAAFIGISVALIGGPGWEPADDWAALASSAVIAATALRVMRPAVAELMDRSPEAEIRRHVEAAARSVPEVRGLHRLKIRRAGGAYFVDLHVQADPDLRLRDAHVVSGKVKSAIRDVLSRPASVLVHMEPDDDPREASIRFADRGDPL